MGVNNSKVTPTQVRLLQDIRVGTKVSFDARLHSTAPIKPDTDVVLHLRDEGQFLVASVNQAQVNAGTFEVASTCTRESLLRVTGTLVAVPSYEYISKDDCSEISVMVSEIVVVAKAIPDLTIVDLHGPGHKNQDSEQLLSTLTLNERLNNRVLDVRVAATASIFKLLSGVFELAVEHQISHGFHWISTPHIINYNITGDNDYFPVAYYDRKDAWLAQTGEFHQQMAISADLKRVFEIRSLFRAETSVSTRRLAEVRGYISLAPEKQVMKMLISLSSLGLRPS
jgi:aspartyl/asparaginyl-tRNA synthetase